MKQFWKLVEWLYLRMENNLAYYDYATECYNKNWYYQVARRRYQDRDVHVILVDIDNLKKINDTKGHPYGDKIIQHVGKILRGLYPKPTGEVCRYGGDEFVIFAVDYNPLTEDLLKSLASVGIYHKSELDSIDMAIELADQAMYQQKT